MKEKILEALNNLISLIIRSKSLAICYWFISINIFLKLVRNILKFIMFVNFIYLLISLTFLNLDMFDCSPSQEDILNKEKLEQDRDLKKNVILIIVFAIMIYIKLKSGGEDSSNIS